jgi:AcrR family transcriptional regulator
MSKTTMKGETLRKSILDAASKLFIERGLSGTSMRDIAHELGMTRTAVYYYFKNKEQILKGLTEHVTLSAKRMSEKVAARRDIDPSLALRGLVEQHAKLILSRPSEFRIVDRNEEDMPPRLRATSEAARRRIFENFSEVIQRGIDSGRFRRVDARVAALAILGMGNWSAWWFKPGGRKTEAEIAALIADLAVHSLQEESRDGRRKATVPERLKILREDLDHIAVLMSGGKS